MDGGDGSHTGSIGSQVISAPMQKGKSITGTLRQIRATDVISSSFIARQREEALARSFACTAVNGEFISGTAGLPRPRLPFAILISNQRRYLARQSPFIPFLPEPSFFFLFVYFHAIFMISSILSVMISQRYSPVSPTAMNRSNYLFLNTTYELN